MPKNSTEAAPESTASSDVADIERQLWEFAKQPDPPSVREAMLRPGAFLYRVHRTWHSLGRGNGLASHSFRPLRDELLQREPPVRNLQAKLYGGTSLSQSDAGHLIDVMLETWEVARDRNDRWCPGPLQKASGSKGDHQVAEGLTLAAIRNNLLTTLFKTNQNLLLEEPVGVPPEIFFEERGKKSLALIIPTKGETTAYLSPTNLYGGFSNLVGRFFDAASQRTSNGQAMPLLIWVLRLRAIRDNSKFHTSFHSLIAYSACLMNWYLRLHNKGETYEARKFWHQITNHSAFVVHGLPHSGDSKESNSPMNEDLLGVEPDFFLPDILPDGLSRHRSTRRHHAHEFGMNVSIDPVTDGARHDIRLNYWLFPDRPAGDLEETADTTGLSVFDAEVSPGRDFDIAFRAIYEAVAFKLGLAEGENSELSFDTLSKMGWQILRVNEFQKMLIVPLNESTR